MGDRRFLLRVGALLAAGLVGGVASLAVASAVGVLGGSTTIQRGRAGGGPNTGRLRAAGGGLTYGDIYAAYASGVVQVEATGPLASDPFDPFPRRTRSLGSGFVIEKSGHIVTNFHVVEGAEIVTVSFSNDESVRAKVVGIDPTTDLAVLKVNTPPRGLTPLRLGKSSSVRVGDEVVAIGNPFGYERSMTAGIVSAIGRVLEAPNELAIDNAIQTDAPINPGNSGGPLLNALGLVIGVNTQIATGGSSNGSVGVGFAIPVDTVRSVTAQIIRVGKVEHAFFGIEATPLTDDIARLFRLPAAGAARARDRLRRPGQRCGQGGASRRHPHRDRRRRELAAGRRHHRRRRGIHPCRRPSGCARSSRASARGTRSRSRSIAPTVASP